MAEAGRCSIVRGLLVGHRQAPGLARHPRLAAPCATFGFGFYITVCKRCGNSTLVPSDRMTTGPV
jgi:hypothetical protein